jgi:hypothetical protein
MSTKDRRHQEDTHIADKLSVFSTLNKGNTPVTRQETAQHGYSLDQSMALGQDRSGQITPMATSPKLQMDLWVYAAYSYPSGPNCMNVLM